MARSKNRYGFESIVIGDQEFTADALDDEAVYKEYTKAMQKAVKEHVVPITRKKDLELAGRYGDVSSEAFIRQTYYMTYEQVAAIEKLSYEKHCRKSDLVRNLIDSALEEYFPGTLKSVKKEANLRREETLEHMARKLKSRD